MKDVLKINYTKKLASTVMDSVPDRFFVTTIAFAVLLLMACEDRKDLLDQEIYEGPVMEMSNINTTMTDSGKLVMRMVAPIQRDYDSGDKEWPDGLELKYYQDSKVPICTFQSNTAHYTAETDEYQGIGSVVVRNHETGDELTTEKLYWVPAEERFYTDNFVTIVADGEIQTGEGLQANQDFTEYEILKPTGTLVLDEEF